jgi:hypothetical protein
MLLQKLHRSNFSMQTQLPADTFRKANTVPNCPSKHYHLSIRVVYYEDFPTRGYHQMTILFATSTRQLFSDVTGNYIDFAANGTTDIQTNVVSLTFSPYSTHLFHSLPTSRS